MAFTDVFDEVEDCVELADCDSDKNEKDILVPAERCAHDEYIYAFETDTCEAKRPCIIDESLLASDDRCLEPVSNSDTPPSHFMDSTLVPIVVEKPVAEVLVEDKTTGGEKEVVEAPSNTDDVIKEVDEISFGSVTFDEESLPTTGTSSKLMFFIAFFLVGLGGILFSGSCKFN